MFSFKLNIKGLDKGKELTKTAYKRILMKSMFKMEELAIDKAPVDTSNLKQKIGVLPQVLNDEYVLTSAASYSEAMEYGTRPFFAPIAPLKDWARRKLGDENIAYAIRNKIAKYGIRAHPFMRPAKIEVEQFWVYNFAADEFNKI
jgi:hypothetical protein